MRGPRGHWGWGRHSCLPGSLASGPGGIIVGTEPPAFPPADTHPSEPGGQAPVVPDASRRDPPRPRRLSALAAALLLLSLSPPARADDDWKYDVVVLKDGYTVLKGLLVNYSEKAKEVELRVVVRK